MIKILNNDNIEKDLCLTLKDIGVYYRIVYMQNNNIPIDFGSLKKYCNCTEGQLLACLSDLWEAQCIKVSGDFWKRVSDFIH